MGAWTIRKAGSAVGEKKDALTLWSIAAAIVLPIVLAVVLVAMDMRADLSELKPNERLDDKGLTLVGWTDLKQSVDFPRRVRMIGYMLDDLWPRGRSRADTFILLPEAGQFLHPAQRVPDQMVVVWPLYSVVLHNRELIWVEGRLSRALRTSGADQPAWAMTFADVTPADEHDLGKWFRP